MTVVRARELIAADTNGFSDPYVSVQLGAAGKVCMSLKGAKCLNRSIATRARAPRQVKRTKAIAKSLNVGRDLRARARRRRERAGALAVLPLHIHFIPDALR